MPLIIPNEIEKSGGKATTYLLDANQEQVNTVHQQAIKEHQRIDYFVNNAGIGGTLAPIHLMTTDNWNNVINVVSTVFSIAYRRKLIFFYLKVVGT